MSAIIKSLQLAQKLSGKGAHHALLLQQAARNMAGWNKDYKPAPFPQTQKEIDAAAKKYYLLPEEYRPYADDGLGYGDYPQLEGGLGTEAKDNYYPYDYPELKRNFNETISVDVDLYGEDRFSQAERPRLANGTYWMGFLGVMTAVTALYYWLENHKMYRPVAAKQYPGEGKVHYTFERK